MKIAHVGLVAACLAVLTHAALADAFFSKASGGATTLSVWKAERNGTITITSGSAAVTGVGTEFTKIFFPAPGYANIASADGTTVLGVIASIESDTQLTLMAPAAGTYADIAFTTESLPTLLDDITINAGHAIDASLGAGMAFGIHHITLNGSLTVDADFFNITGDLTINTGGTLTTSPTTRIVFDGTSTIGGTLSPITLDYLRVKGSAVVTLANPLIVNHLEMEGGRINTGSSVLTLGASAVSPGTFGLTGPGAGISGFIIGTFTRWIGPGSIGMGDMAGYFPMGAGTNFRKVWIAKPHAGSGTVTVTHTDASGTSPFAVAFSENALTFDKRHNMSWTIAAGNGYAGATDLRVQASGLDPVQMEPANLSVSLADGAAGGTYTPSGIVDGDTTASRSGLTETELSSTFYIAAAHSAPLPVELVSFTASAGERTIELRWKTATEKNNYGFEIERSALGIDASVRQWEKIGFVAGAGTTNAPQAYAFSDRTGAGTAVYRLKQIDRDGRYEYSREIETASAFGNGRYELTQNYPNPFNPATTIRFMLQSPQRAVLKVYNAIGQEVRTLFNGPAEPNVMHAVTFDAHELPSGLYFYALISGGRTEVKKMQLLK